MLKAMLGEEEPPVTEMEIEAALADPVLGGLIAQALAPYQGRLTEKGLGVARRTLATVFLRDERGSSIVSRMRSSAEGSGTREKSKAVVTPARRRRKGV